MFLFLSEPINGENGDSRSDVALIDFAGGPIHDRNVSVGALLDWGQYGHIRKEREKE